MRQIDFLDVSDPLFQARFFQQVKSNGLCWEWQGTKSRFGYGIVLVNGKHTRAHRVSFVMAYGSIADDKLACHTCDNPSCVNPLHLYEGTDKENTADCIARGRRGGHQRKLTEAQVVEARARYVSHAASQTELAQEYGIARSAMQRLLRGQNYQTASGPIAAPKKGGRQKGKKNR